MHHSFSTKFYLITDSAAVSDQTFEKRLTDCLKAGITMVQLREKTCNTREFIKRATFIQSICNTFHVPLIINDRIDVALAIDAHGVHLGKEDMPIDKARILLGENKIIGASAKTIKDAILCEQLGADYIGTGAIFKTTTKVKTTITPISTLIDICKHVTIPVNAIGGLNAKNLNVLNHTPIAGICVVSALMYAIDPYTETKQIINAFNQLSLT